jgi:uncharacterized protein YecE (DUF72 family)
MKQIRVGVSGWTYPPWRGNFYPKGLPQKKELAFASRWFGAIEINGTFYSLQTPSSFETWYQETPAEFLFTLKGGRFVTHLRKLREPRQGLANYFASGLLRLREKLGPILWQFPPQFGFDEERFKAFFEMLPYDMQAMAKFGKEHDDRVKGVDLEVDENRPVRHAVEFRHESFLTDRFLDLLRKHNVALVVADVASKFPTAEDVTSDFVYVRLHGSRQLYASGYTPKEIAAWAEKIRVWHKGTEPKDARRIGPKSPSVKGGRDVYVFFDNTDVKLRAPVDARRMAETLKIGPTASVKEVLGELGVKSKASTGTPKNRR